ncbi:zinc ABC transporter solute-binding protein [Azospirillum sp. RWY-5-1]|uniref:Zinc ABC transporter solute-binding protein n=1 Tax=Azospirillum oleiclasticum TaxID=2735135 RepID=A0ABX2T6G2_9PROT|nr:zinc ABC transporter substrate-binding protein [Azospirillum oleiclasticum]NYZ12611.1 zinc ABC transporter solute-binding protein [Azospirillum oleiclasticum]NYZ19771.1 zinc ABC transporter solute-binding protein [Azospirillum oleiclasticum]
MTHSRTPAFSRRAMLAGGAALSATALLPLQSAAAQGGFTALATTGMVGDILRHLVGDRGRVEVLLGSGVDPHTYKLTRADIGRLMGADIVVYNGLLLEGKMTDALVRVASSGRPVLAVTEDLGDDYLLSPKEFEGQYDPHVWMDVGGWIRATAKALERLTAFRPADADAFAANAAAYTATLRDLDAYARRVLGSVEPQRRVLVTAHDAFGYFGRAYGFEVLGIQGISTESETGLRRIQELVDTLVTRNIPAVFVETTVSDRNVRALVEGSAARGHRVAIGGALFSDAMGAPGSYEGTYVGMIDHNVTTIARALGGAVPARGMAGRLAAL